MIVASFTVGILFVVATSLPLYVNVLPDIDVSILILLEPRTIESDVVSLAIVNSS